mgnify:FL=1
MSFFIGNIEIKNNLVLAPMAGFSNTTFRKICKSMGAGLVVCEMVSDKAIMYDSKKTYELLKMDEQERPISQQIFGSDKESFVIAAKKIVEYMHPDIIDINMGCPVPKVAVKSQAGSALLKNPDKIYEIVKSVVESVDVPVTVKIRSGWDEKNINAVEVAKVIEKAGASAITIHGRTRSLGYSGKVDLDIIKSVVESVNIPVIGNGDVLTVEDYLHMIEYTGCQAVMIGRGALGNPWIFKNILDYLSTGTYTEPTLIDRFNMMKYHINELCKDKNETVAILEMRTFLMYYLKGIENTKELKVNICKCKSKEELINLLDEFIEKYNVK